MSDSSDSTGLPVSPWVMDLRTLAARPQLTPVRSTTDEHGYLAERSRIDLRTRLLTHCVTFGLGGFFAVLFAMPHVR